MFSFFHLGPHFATAPAPIKVTMPNEVLGSEDAAVVVAAILQRSDAIKSAGGRRGQGPFRSVLC
jgi:hypothetical protein